MGSRSLGTLTLDLIAKIGGFTGPMDQAARTTKKSTDSISSNLKSLSKGAALLGVGAAAGFGLMIKHSIDLQDELSKSSQKIGVSVEDLSALRYTADLAGVAFGDLEGSLGKFSKNIGETFSSGVGAAADAFSDLGIKVTDTNGQLKSTEQLFSEVADRFAVLEDGAVKTALSMDLFGKSGKDLIPLLNSGSKGLREGADEAKRLGVVLSGPAAKAAEDFNDNMSRLGYAIDGVANAAAGAVVGDLSELTKTLQDPATQQALTSLASLFSSLAVASVNAVVNLGTFVNFLSRDLEDATDAAVDDIAYLQKQFDDITAQEYKIQFSADFKDDKKTQTKLENLYRAAELVQKRIDAAKAKQVDLGNVPQYSADVMADPFSQTLSAAQIKGNAELREANKKKSLESAAAAKELQKQYDDMLENLQKQIDLNGISSKQSEIAFEIEKGNLKGISAELLKNISARAKSVDLIERNNELLRSQREVDIASMGDAGRLASVQLEYDLKHGIIKLNDEINEQDKQTLINNKKLVEEKEKVNDINEYLKNQQRTIDFYGLTNDALRLQYDIQHDILKVSGGINSKQAQQLIANQKQIDAQEKIKSLSELTAEAADRIDESFADAWKNIDKGFTGLRDGILDGFKTMLGEMAHQALTKPIVLGIQEQFIGSGASAASAGIYAAAALAVVAGVSAWNKQQDEKFVKLTAEYKQANQGLSAILGAGNKESEAIAKGIESLKSVNDNVLDVNYGMLSALQDIRASIGNVAAGFARTLTGSSDYKALGIKEGKSTVNTYAGAAVLGGTIGLGIKGVGDLIGGEIGGFINGSIDKISGLVYGKTKKVIDSGIHIVGGNLSDILSGSVLQAFNYADVKTTKKFLGITTSAKLKRSTEDLDSIFEAQISEVFGQAGKSLKTASSVFGINFDEYVNQLKIKTQDLSLKGLEGDALTKAIESFFSSTLDSWASVLLTGTDVLEQYQKVGESAFDTFVRLASETRTFEDYAEKLGLNFKLTGLAAVNAVQDVADLAGGFDSLSASTASYYDKFFSDAEKFNNLQESISGAYAKINVALPHTREEFRHLIESLDLGTEAGRQQYATLIGLTNVTDSYLTALDKETQAKSEAQKAAEDTQKAAEEALKNSAGAAFDAFQKAIQANMDKVQKALSSSKQVADSLAGALHGMHLQSIENDILGRRAAQAQVITANAIRKAGGPLPKAGELDDALAALTQPSQDMFATFADYARDFYITQKNIKELSDAAGGQVSIEEQNLVALQESLDYYQKQIDILNGIDDSVLSVRDSVLRLTNALIDAGVPAVMSMPAIPALNNDYENKQNAIYASVLNKANSDSSSTAETTAKTTTDMAATLNEISENLQTSQFAIAKNTLEISKMLKRWDIDGAPPERVEETV